MKRILTFLALAFTTLVFSSCILFSTPLSSTISINENTTQTFSVIAYGSLEWFVNDISTGVTESVFEYTPPPGSADETHIVSVRSAISGQVYEKQWIVNNFSCETRTLDIGAGSIENNNDLNGIAGYTDIEGDLTISQDPDLTANDDDLTITNLDMLECLHQINGNLTLSINPNLANIDGLQYLTEVTGDVIINSNSITTLNLRNLTTIGGALIIQANATLTSLNGLESLTSVGSDITLSANAMLNDVNGLNKLENINGNLKIEDHVMLPNLDDLNLLKTISGDLTITTNYNLSKMTLYYLDTIGGNLTIQNNTVDLGIGAGLNINFESLASLGGGINISDNIISFGASEDPITLKLSFNNLTSIPGTLAIARNTGLITVGSIEPGSINGFPNLLSISGNLEIKNNNELNILLLPVIESIGTDLSIFENITLPSCFAEQIVNQATIGGNSEILGNLPDSNACDDPTGEETE